jgi:hypothetical protein
MATSEVLHVVIDERKQVRTRVDDLQLGLKQSAHGFSTTNRVFKDYILSSEVFRVDYNAHSES